MVYTINTTGTSIWGGVDMDSMNVLGGSLKAASGVLSSVSGFNQMLAVNNKLNQGYALWNLAGQKVYCPQTIFGVSSKSAMEEDAKKFVSYVFRTEAQKLDQGGGFPINRKAFDAATIDMKDMPEMSICHSNQETGEMVELTVSWPKKADFDALREKIESLDTPTLMDDVIKEAVIEQAVKYMKDECGVEDAVAALVQKVNLYLAE
jgi:ABC-type glycerol-3-phosphate transport system substrate-binding protein